jgi:hypothetical protein
VNLRQLSNFLQIAELQSFTRAASVLHLAQLSLSRQIQILEHELGVLLFVRSDKGVKLTDAGVALQERANAVLQQPDFASFDLSSWRIGGYGGAPMAEATIAALAQKLPNVGLHNCYGSTETTSPVTILPSKFRCRASGQHRLHASVRRDHRRGRGGARSAARRLR